jgi:glycosyltransferase involved in cell wall biosynthesis
MKILMPARIVDRHVGGNTTYGRHIEAGLTARGIPVGRIPAASKPALTMMQETLTGLLPGRSGDILHYLADTGPLLRTRRPSVVTVHGVASRWINSARTTSQESVWRNRVQRAINSTDHVITVSNSSATDISHVFDINPANITTILHGIDATAFAERREISEELRAKLPERFALYLGNIEPRKNLGPLVAAFSGREIASLGIPLVIAGKPAWNSKESMALIEASPNVHYVGFVSDSDRIALMQECELFMFPSLYEGFGFPVLEALAAGAVVLTSDRGSLAEVAGPSIIMDDLSSDGIATAVEAALADADRRNACRAQGPSWAGQFSWDRSVDDHVRVYEGLLSR